MDWTTAVDNYCERLGPGLWAEPLNFASNAAFIVAALVMAWRCRGIPHGQMLPGLLFLIGIGSGLFHSVATRWASMADVIPIVIFILAYLWRANRDFLALQRPAAAIATLAFLPFAAVTVPLFSRLTWLGSTAGYAPVPVVIFLYALLLARPARATAQGLFIGGVLLLISMTFRALDMPLCGGWPIGTHFAWHLVNGLLLGWMIEVWRRHQLPSA